MVSNGNMPAEEVSIDSVLKKFLLSKGITSLYPPQVEALNKGVLNGKNIVLASHTASGKTLVAELVILKRFIEGSLNKAVYMVPLKAIASEKYEEFKELSTYGLKIALSTGDYDSDDEFLREYDVIITTNEKFDSLLRHRPSWLKDISVLVVDEIHYIDDVKRGPVIEGVISKVKSLGEVQIIALSATISNADEIAKWLDAECVVSDWRPVPLREGIYYNGTIMFNDGAKVYIKKVFNNPILDLVYDTMVKGGQALIFTNTRRLAVQLAMKIASKLGVKGLDFLLYKDVRNVMEELEKSSNVSTLNKQLSSLAACGVSFHHAGLTYTQRKIIERYFRRGIIKVVVATPTLAAGVNLPARRVIIHSHVRYEPGLGSVPIKTMEYKQMCGRAGRPGYDEIGEAIIIARSEFDIDKLWKMYVLSKPETLFSKLGREHALRTYILALIASRYAKDLKDIMHCVKHTLYYKQFGRSDIEVKLHEIIGFLSENHFIVKTPTLKPTILGKRVSELYIDPLSAIVFVKGLKDVSKVYDVGVLVLITLTPDMPKLSVRRTDFKNIDMFLEENYPYLPLDPYEISFITEYTIASAIKTAMFLYDWINERDEESLVKKYGLGPGDIYSLVESAEWLAYSLRELAKLMVSDYRVIQKINTMYRRVKAGVKEELLELIKLEGIGRIRARSLYNSGYRTLNDIAKASVGELINVRGIGVELARKIIKQAKEIIKGHD